MKRYEYIADYVSRAIAGKDVTAELIETANREARAAWKKLPESEKTTAKRGSWEDYREWLAEAPRTEKELEAYLETSGSDRMKRSATAKAEWKLAQNVWAKVRKPNAKAA